MEVPHTLIIEVGTIESKSQYRFPSNEELRIIIITLGSMITKIGDAISSIASTFNLDETNNVENQQHLDEQE